MAVKGKQLELFLLLSFCHSVSSYKDSSGACFGMCLIHAGVCYFLVFKNRNQHHSIKDKPVHADCPSNLLILHKLVTNHKLCGFYHFNYFRPWRSQQQQQTIHKKITVVLHSPEKSTHIL